MASLKTSVATRSARSTVVCSAVPQQRAARRAVLAGLLLPALLNVPQARALIPVSA